MDCGVYVGCGRAMILCVSPGVPLALLYKVEVQLTNRILDHLSMRRVLRVSDELNTERPAGRPPDSRNQNPGGPIGAFRRAVAQLEVLRADINDAMTPRPSPGACSSRLGGASPWLQSPSHTSLDTLCHPSPFHRAGASLIWARLTDLRFCCAANVVTASVARDVDGCRNSSNRLLGAIRQAHRPASTAKRSANPLLPLRRQGEPH